MRKPSMYAQQVKCILLLHIIDTFTYYSKYSDKITRGGQVCFSTRLFFLAMWNTEKPVQTVRDLWGLNRMAWTQIISYTSVSSSVMVCDWCGGLFGMWLQLGVPLGIFFLTEALLPPSHPHHLPPPTCPL